MFTELQLTNVGPAPAMKLAFGERLNLITGDNGLGKSFLLDIAWWSLTRKWPAEINPQLTSGKKVRPDSPDAKIKFRVTGKTGQPKSYHSEYRPKEQAWVGSAGRPINPGLVLYAMSDGSFAVWDPARNYWISKKDIDIQDRQPAYVFSPSQVWDGLPNDNGGWLCNGLIRDWAGWQKEKGLAFTQLKDVLKVLSPSMKEILEPGELTRISIDDSRDIPTVRMPYGKDIPVVYASSGMRRVIALAYFLIWAWQEHQEAAKLIQEEPTQQITFLIDEVESHLHPSWQRSIVPALLNVMDTLTPGAGVQLITATHSPLIMASVEPLFDPKQDAWFDLDLENQQVVLRHREFVRRGDISNWLTSEAFDLPSARSLEAEKVLERAAKALSHDNLDRASAQKIDLELRKVLSDTDPFWMRWRFVAEKKEWL